MADPRVPRICRICAQVDPFDLIELDTLMGDPLAWPATVWGSFKTPAGDLSASYRRFGAVEMGVNWIVNRGLPLTRGDVRRHYRFDVPKLAVAPDDLVNTGLIARGNTKTGIAKLDAQAYLTYYNEGIQVGIQGLQILRDRITALQRAGTEVPLALAKMAIDVGSKLAMSQAAIKAAGKPMGDVDDDDGFRAGSAPAPSVRIGHQRVRLVDGESRPVRDVGPADREAYSERAVQEGGAGLPHPT